MIGDPVRIAYTGSALPGNAELVVLFNTVVALPGGNFAAMYNLARFQVYFKNDQAGTFNGYHTINRGTSYVQFHTAAVAAAGAGLMNLQDIFILPFMDFKFEWLNGATPQTSFGPQMCLSNETAKVT